MSTVAALLKGLAGPIAKRAFVALGLSVVTYTGVDAAVTGLLGSAAASMAFMNPDVVQLVAMSGSFKAMSIISGGIVARVSLQALKRIIPDGS